MHTDRDPHRSSNSDVDFEKTDVHAKPFLFFILGISAFILVVMIAMYGVVRVREHQLRSKYADLLSTPALENYTSDQILDPHLPEVRRAARAAQDKLLSSYGWLNPAEGRVHIPIERAMELTVKERGGK